jgi:hypothetical protein
MRSPHLQQPSARIPTPQAQEGPIPGGSEKPMESIFGSGTDRDNLELTMLEFGYLADSFADTSQQEQSGMYF